MAADISRRDASNLSRGNCWTNVVRQPRRKTVVRQPRRKTPENAGQSAAIFDAG